MIPQPVIDTFNRLKKQEKACLQLKTINNRYYVYSCSSKWDKNAGKPKKITTYRGIIRSDGTFVDKSKRKIRFSSRGIYEYGNAILASQYLEDVKSKLPSITRYHREIIAMAIIRAIDNKPLRLVASRWEKLYLSQTLEPRLSPKYLSAALKDIGEKIPQWYKLFSELVSDNDLLLYDLTSILNYSKYCKLAEKGYNKDHIYEDQLGLMMAFSTESFLPVGIDVFYGSIKDIKTIRQFLEGFSQNRIGLVLDRGFFSFQLAEELRRRNMWYVIPLRKNAQLMDTRWVRWKGPFSYRKRSIRWGRKNVRYGHLYFYYDPSLKGEEEQALLRRVEEGQLTMEEFEQYRLNAGIIGLITNCNKPADQIFSTYKGRQDVEVVFDVMKNTLDADKPHLREEEAIRGYFFVSFLALRVYYKILKRLKEQNMAHNISPEEVLLELSKMEIIREPDQNEYFATISKKVERIVNLFPAELPMG